MAGRKVKMISLPKCNTVCVASLTTTLHVTLPLAKCMAQLGSVNVITEDKAFLALSSKYEAEYVLGNMRVRVVDLVSDMDEEELEINDYDFTIIIVNEFLPDYLPDKYIFLSAKEYYRAQMSELDMKQKPIYSLFRPECHTAQERDKMKNQRFVNEVHYSLGSPAAFDRFMYQVMSNRKFNAPVPVQVAELIARIMDGHQDATKRDIKAYLRRPDF